MRKYLFAAINVLAGLIAVLVIAAHRSNGNRDISNVVGHDIPRILASFVVLTFLVFIFSKTDNSLTAK